MKKNVSLIILVIAFLASCQAIPVSEPTATIASTNTIEPTPTPIPVTLTPSSTSIPPTPTEIFIKPEYLAGLEEWEMDKQFPITKIVTDTRTNKEIKLTYCAFDFMGQNKVDFKYANLLILRVAKCYFIDTNGRNQFVTVPLLMYNKNIDKYDVYSAVTFIDGKIKPSEAYFDGLFKQLQEQFHFKKYTLLHFQFNAYTDKDWIDFFGEASSLFGEPSEKFYNEGDVSEFPDFKGAENFIFPSSMWNDRGE